MQSLVDGVHAFQAKYFASHRELFTQLAETGQRPETLFITCSDSRVVPNLITSSAPGELFIIRNVGNIVPEVDLAGGTSASIEYAVEVLQVQNVIVCGHTHCGAMQAVLAPSTVDHLPRVKRWLAQGERLRSIVAERYGHLSERERLTAAVEENVLVQLENLRAYSFLAKRLEEGKLRMSGWVFTIETGQVFDYDPKLGQFLPMEGPLALAAPLP
jgi:carbonic anhydrase